MKLATTFAGLTLAIAAAYSAPAVSQTIHANSSGPTARCQASVAMSELAIRKRPLAMQNNSTTDGAWVTCAFPFDSGAAIENSAELVDTYFWNYSSTEKTVTCSGVTGWEGGDNEYVSLSLDIPANSGGTEDANEDNVDDGNLFWSATDFEGGGMGSGLVMINCYLPPGTGINDTYVYWASETAE